MSSEKDTNLKTRRDFFRQASCAAVGTWALSSTIRDLRLINAAMAAGPITGYKALVCLFLAGGNDSNNWIVPTDSSTYADYAAIRGNLALPQSSLLSLRTGTGGAGPIYFDADGHSYGFHPSCPHLQTLFGEGTLVPIMNVGTLVRPTTRAQYLANPSFYRPPQIFSHSDQVTQWQTSIPDQPPLTGWGGRVADILNSVANPTGKISMSVSLNGNNTFEIGNLVSQYHVSQTGAVTLSFASNDAPRTRPMRAIMGVNQPNLQRTAYRDVLSNAVVTGELLNTNIAATSETAPANWVWTNPFPSTPLGNQLKMIARLIQARGPSALDMNRQIFFCSVGGYDTHTAQVTDPLNSNGLYNPTTGSHATLLDEVSRCMFAFQKAMEQLQVSDQVTTFTASDFSRTFPTNSQGSDHGWGAHHLVMGGAVNRWATYGHLPTFAINGPDDTGTGRWIPTLAVDQYSATLAKWFGLENNEIEMIFPNLTRFPTADLGFLA